MLGMMMQRQLWQWYTLGCISVILLLWLVSKDTETLVSILALCYSNIFCYNIILSSVLPFNAAKLLACSPISLALCSLGRGMQRQPFLLMVNSSVFIWLNTISCSYSILGRNFSLPFVYCFLSWWGRGNLSLLDFPFILVFPCCLLFLGCVSIRLLTKWQ